MTRLEGGLGNQMFQYALGRHLATIRGQELVLDTSVLARAKSKRQYELDCFNVSGTLSANYHHIKPHSTLWIVREIHFGFDPTILSTECPNLMIHGFWQTERYFLPIADLIRNDFAFVQELPSLFDAIRDDIRHKCSVCIHIRRTDYLDPQYNMGVLPIDFYHQACTHIRSTIANPHFFIFSDDLEWCSKNMNFAYPYTIVPPAKKGTQHLQLMTQCRHFIIANSTFSWWAAWLGNAKDKVVIAPKRWFRDDLHWDANTSMLIKSDDITPPTWLRL